MLILNYNIIYILYTTYRKLQFEHLLNKYSIFNQWFESTKSYVLYVYDIIE